MDFVRPYIVALYAGSLTERPFVQGSVDGKFAEITWVDGLAAL